MNLVERCGKLHDLIRKLMETQDYETIKLLGEVISGDEINIRKTYMVATKSFKDKLGDVRANIVEEYDSELGINKIQAGIIAESQHVLKNYEGQTVGHALKSIKEDLQYSLNKFLKDNEVYQNHFPVKFENGLGKWEINSDGTTNVQPKKGMQHIVCDFIVKNTGIVEAKEFANLESAYAVYNELMLTPQWRYNHRMNFEWLIKNETTDPRVQAGPLYRQLTKEEFKERLLMDDSFNKKWGMDCTIELSDDERKNLLQEKRARESGSNFISPGIWVNDIGPSGELLEKEGIPKRRLR